MTVISMLGAIMIWFGGNNVFGVGRSAWNIAAFTIFFSCYQKLAVKLSKAAKLFNAGQKAQVFWKRIKPYLGSAEDEPEFKITSGFSLSVRNVTFAYHGQETLLDGVTYQAGEGETIGITGKITCGKLTLGKLLIGELPDRGTISLGDICFSDQGERYETCVGYLGHQPEFFLVGQSRKISAWESLETLVRCLELSVSTGRRKNSRMAFIPSLTTAASVFRWSTGTNRIGQNPLPQKAADGSG